MEATGVWTVERRSRDTGELLGDDIVAVNTIQVAGLQKFLDIMFGLNSPVANDQLNNARAQLKIYTEGSYVTPVKTLSCKSGYPNAVSGSPSPSVQYWWDDVSIDSYTPYRLDIHNSVTSLHFARRDNPGFGSKTEAENWTYKYTLSLSRGADADIQSTALTQALKMFTGEVTPFVGTGWEQPQLFVEASGGTPTTTVTRTGGYPQRTNQTVTIQFVAASGGTAGAGTNIDWYHLSIRDTVNQTILSKTLEDLKTKTPQTTRTYTWTMTLS